jgi:hypothetical protein
MKNNDHIVKVKLIEEGILCSELPIHTFVTKELIDNEIYQRQTITNDPHAFLVKLHGIKNITDDGWEIISGDLFNSITLALAILFDKESGFYEHGKIMVDLKFLSRSPVKYPVKFFDDEEAALSWLRSFKK